MNRPTRPAPFRIPQAVTSDDEWLRAHAALARETASQAAADRAAHDVRNGDTTEYRAALRAAGDAGARAMNAHRNITELAQAHPDPSAAAHHAANAVLHALALALRQSPEWDRDRVMTRHGVRHINHSLHDLIVTTSDGDVTLAALPDVLAAITPAAVVSALNAHEEDPQ